MRLVTYAYDATECVGALKDGAVVDLSPVATSMLALIDLGAAGLAEARRLFDAAAPSALIPLDRVALRAPIPRPRRNIICLGMNYVAHAYESARARGKPEVLPDHPVFFTKATSTVIGPDQDVPLHEDVTSQLDWEVELALVIGKAARHVPLARAMEYVFGYTVLNDVSARDLQSRHQQFFFAKSLDACGPMGPWIVTADEIPDPHALSIRMRLNGQTVQDSTTSDQIFTIAKVIEVLSAGMTLEPGDIVSTGTPAGVGMGMSPQRWLQDGDVMEAEVQGVGVLRNAVRRAGGTP